MDDVAVATPGPESIHRLMGRVLAEMPAIGKDQVNASQGFKFRGIDDVLNALNPLLSAHGVYVLPDVLERIAETRTTNNNKPLYTVHLHVRFRFYGPGGDCVEASGWGEGTDSGDKATNKAMTSAFKYVLFQAFAISTEEASKLDADGQTPPPTLRPLTPEEDAVVIRLEALPAEAADLIRGYIAKRVYGDEHAAVIWQEIHPDWWAKATDLIDKAEAKIASAGGSGNEGGPTSTPTSNEGEEATTSRAQDPPASEPPPATEPAAQDDLEDMAATINEVQAALDTAAKRALRMWAIAQGLPISTEGVIDGMSCTPEQAEKVLEHLAAA